MKYTNVKCKRCRKIKYRINSNKLCRTCIRIIKNICTNCGQNRPKRNKRVCKECIDKKRLIYWGINKTAKHIYSRKYSLKKRLKRKKKLLKILGGKCIDCDFDRHHAALDFDHIDPSIKKFSLSKKMVSGSWKELVKEAKKCVIRCSNCHRIKTFYKLDKNYIPIDLLKKNMILKLQKG